MVATNKIDYKKLYKEQRTTQDLSSLRTLSTIRLSRRRNTPRVLD
jgi:hypothetical protein